MDIHSSRFMLIAALFSLGLYTGCGAPAKPAVADRQEPQYSESLNDSVADAKRLNDEIRDAFAAGDLQAADGPVHEIGHLLASLSEHVGQMSLSDADQQKVDFAINSLMVCFGRCMARVLAGGYGAILLWWLMASYWSGLQEVFVAHRVERRIPLRLSVVGSTACVICVLAAVLSGLYQEKTQEATGSGRPNGKGGAVRRRQSAAALTTRWIVFRICYWTWSGSCNYRRKSSDTMRPLPRHLATAILLGYLCFSQFGQLMHRLECDDACSGRCHVAQPTRWQHALAHSNGCCSHSSEPTLVLVASVGDEADSVPRRSHGARPHDSSRCWKCQILGQTYSLPLAVEFHAWQRSSLPLVHRACHLTPAPANLGFLSRGPPVA
ncbi:MAG: hypothetical protein R3E01_07250 [Pirellulaceae bacterium]|nr:hypothetical protein [Planctomycetales bacterium]